MRSPIQGHSQPAIRTHNRGAVLRVILSRGPISRLEISRITGVTPATVTHIVSDLIASGSVCELGEADEARQGRKSILIDLCTESARVAAVDIRVNAVQIGLSNLRAQILDSMTLPLGPNPDSVAALEAIASSLQHLLASHGLRASDLLGIGVGAVGLVDYAAGINRVAANLGWRDVPVGATLQERLGVGVVVDNNVRAMALGEKLVGLGKDSTNLVFLHIGWGIGSGLIVQHELYRGSGFYAGEVGHMTVVPDGRLCTCGNRGCLETVASGAALVAEAQQVQDPNSLIAQMAAEGNLTPSSLLRAAVRGDEAARQILRCAAGHIGAAVGSLINLLSPELVVLAGSLIDGDTFLIDLVRQVAQERSYVARAAGGIPIVASTLGPLGGLRGAAALALERFFYGLQPMP